MSRQGVVKKQNFYFLCGNFAKRNFIYAVKNAGSPWHYFEEQDSLSSAHGLLPVFLDNLINGKMLNKVRTVEVPLDDYQWMEYYDNEKFIFKNKELKTYLQLTDEQSKKASNSKSSYRHTDRLVFISGQTNPLLFVNEYEKCRDLKDDKDRMFKIRNFVDAPHKAEFNEMYFTSDWPRVRQTFIKKYSSSFTENKKANLSIDFHQETSLRSFVELKLKSLSSYTTLPFLNQMEMVLADLPNPIAKLFLVNEIMTSNKSAILDFCDSVQDLVLTMIEKTDEPEKKHSNIPNPLNSLEIFTYDSELESQNGSMLSIETLGSGAKKRRIENVENLLDDSSQSSTNTMSVEYSSNTQRGAVSGSSTNIVKKRRGRPRKNLVTIPEESVESGSSVLDDSSQSSISSTNTMSVDYSAKTQRGSVSGSSTNIVKKRRGRPRKNLVTIPEEPTDSETSNSSSTQLQRFKPY